MAEYDKSLDTFARRMLMLGMFKGGEALTAKAIGDRLGAAGEDITERSVQRGLEMLVTGGYLEVVNPGGKPLHWRWPKGKKTMTLPRMADQEVLAFRLLELFLEPLLPRDIYDALRPYFGAARRELDRMPFWASLRNWESKVRVVPPAQPLLPPEPPPARLAETSREDWQRSQEKVRYALLDALFNNRQCEVHYQQLWRDEPARWTVHPLVYLQRGPAFYLLCTIDAHADVRQLALHRLLSAKVLDQKASPPAGFNVDREV